MKINYRAILLLLFIAIIIPKEIFAKEAEGNHLKKIAPPSINAACTEATVQSDLAVNNVRCRILMGDMWWDLTNPVYEIPKDGGVTAIFAGSLWIGGVDEGGNLKVAAQTYRLGGVDFWPGPLDITNASVNLDVCSQYDKHFRITRAEVESFASGGPITPAISSWPGNGDQSLGQAQYLAPFKDGDHNGVYDPTVRFIDIDGISKPHDYPGYDLVSNDGYGDCQLNQCIPVDQLFGDETIWWVFNDKGNIHEETNSDPIGLEIRGQAFGFFTDDEINNMTFYNYRIFNRSSFTVDSCFFGVWTDGDLGCYDDDYVGCDVKRGLGYTYNADNDDQIACGNGGYGLNPPAVGIDFFRGPIADAGDGKNNDRDSSLDESCEEIIMSGFLAYRNKNGVPDGNPVGDDHYYNYLNMKLDGGAGVTYGSSTGPACQFMYPGDTDEHDWGIGGNYSTTPTLAPWVQTGAPADFRILESAGPFTLLPGAVNVLTTGVVWARATAGGAQASVKLLQVVDDKAQALFDNCFKVLDGPTAPDLTIQELDKELILYLSNTDPNSNNFNEGYKELDTLITLVDKNGISCPGVNRNYNFEGYKIYQLNNSTVSSTDLENPDKARLVYQCDVKNGVGRLINYEFDQSLGGSIPKEKVNGSDLGLSHSIKITTDAFATGDPTLINHKTYYFMAVAYGYNQFKKYEEDLAPTDATMCDPSAPAYTGQKKPYKQGRKNLRSISAIPHISAPYTGGTEMHAVYGNGPRITRIEGNGNGGMELELTASTVSEILSSSDGRAKTPTYDYGKGPINVRVIDPLNVPDGHSFTLKFDTSDISNSTWTLINNTTGDIIPSDKTIAAVNEQLFLQWGLSISIVQGIAPGDSTAVNNGFMSATMTFADPSKKWLNGVADKEGEYYENWIRSGTVANISSFQNDYATIDAGEIYEGLLGGTWAPYRLVAGTEIGSSFDPKKYYTGPGFRNQVNLAEIAHLASVDVVLTNDKSKWTRSVVLEMCEDSNFSSNTTGIPAKARKFDFRRAASVDKNGSTATSPDNNDYATGMGWFPGYAINLETGERLNIAFGENSALTKRAGSGVINYDPRYTLTYSLSAGTFIAGEEIKSRKTIPSTADVVSVNGSAMVVRSMSGTFSSTDTIDGITSGAIAVITSINSPEFQLHETITGATSGATGIITANVKSTDMMLVNTVSGTFAAGELITAGTSSVVANVITYSTYDFEQNGADMKWNPTSVAADETPWATGTKNPVFGGQHYIYVFGHNRENDAAGTVQGDFVNIYRYDAGKSIRDILGLNNGTPGESISSKEKSEIFKDAMWVNIPLLTASHSLLETDVTIRLRVAKPYKYGYSNAFFKAGNKFIYPDTASTAFGQNTNLPMYTFTTEGISTHTGENEIAVEALDIIRVVPNPYYAYSNYEANQLDNRVKITNLPEQCTVSIFNLGGTLVRKYKKGMPLVNLTPKEVTSPDSWHDGSLDWDLKNTAGIPISSGVYIVHVEVPGVGEKVIKWFGIMRPVDLDSF